MAKIKLAKCMVQGVVKTLKGLGLAADGSVKACVGRLSDYYADNADKLDIALCDVCRGESDAALDACPFCGTLGESGDETEEEAAEKKAAKEKDAPPPFKKKSAAKKKAASEKKVAPKIKKGEAPIIGGKKPATKTKATKKKAAPPAPVEVNAVLVALDASKLDAAVEECRRHMVTGAVALYDLGVVANRISEGLWKLRTSDNGVAKYRSFKHFCQLELGMSPTHIYRAIQCSKEFSRSEIEGLTGNQIRIVMNLPKGEQTAAVVDAQEGSPPSQISDKSRERRELQPAPKAVTIAMTMGQRTLKLYQRPGRGARVGDVDSAIPTKTMSDGVWTAMDLSNNVRMIVRFKKNTIGELVATFEFRRGEPAV